MAQVAECLSGKHEALRHPPQKKEKMTVGAKAQKVVFNPGVFYFQGFQFKTGHQNV
jgi:hypothetical protein